MPAMTTAALTGCQGSSCWRRGPGRDGTVGVAGGPDLVPVDEADSGLFGAAEALSTWSMMKLMSPGWFPMSPPSGPPGV